MRIFITGGTGFIGLPLLKRLLQSNHEIMVLTRKGKDFLEQSLGLDLANKISIVQSDIHEINKYQDKVIDFGPEIVYHLAWEGIPDHGPEMSKKNLENGLAVYNLAIRAKAKSIITTGSCWEYGNGNGILSGEIDENCWSMPRDSFSAAKTALRIIGQELAKKNGCDFIWARLFYVYGPRQREKSLIPSIISSVKDGIRPEIKTPFSKNDFSYVEDVAEGLYSFTEYYSKHPEDHINGIFNIGSGKSTQVQEIVQKVGKYFGHGYLLQEDVSDKAINFWSDNNKLENLTGWKPKTKLDDGIKEMCCIAEGQKVKESTEIKTILVTGNLGYIGSVLVPMLVEKGYSVIGYDTDFYDSDCFLYPEKQFVIKQIIKDTRDVTREDLRGVDAVIHLAALSNDPLGEFNPQLTRAINFEATIKMALCAKDAGVKRFIYASSQSMYGVSKSEKEITEDQVDTSAMITEYARTKWEAEKVLHQLNSEEFTVVCFRPSTVFGASPKLRLDIVFNNLVACAYATGKIEIKSDGTPWRPVVHVRDVSNAFIAGLTAPKERVANQSYNVGIPNGNFTVRNLAEAAQKSVPGSSLVFTGEHGPDSRTYKVSFDKILTELKGYYNPEWNLERGGKELVEVFKKAGLTEADFRGRKFIRINQLKHLVQNNNVDENLKKNDDL